MPVKVGADGSVSVTNEEKKAAAKALEAAGKSKTRWIFGAEPAPSNESSSQEASAAPGSSIVESDVAATPTIGANVVSSNIGTTPVAGTTAIKSDADTTPVENANTQELDAKATKEVPPVVSSAALYDQVIQESNASAGNAIVDTGDNARPIGVVRGETLASETPESIQATEELKQAQQELSSVTTGTISSENKDEGAAARKAKREAGKHKIGAARKSKGFDVGYERPSIKETFLNIPIRFAKQAKRKQMAIKAKLKNKTFIGTAFYETLFSINIPPNCVSLGSQNIIEAILNPDSIVLSRINYAIRAENKYRIEKGQPQFHDELTVDDCIGDIPELIRIVNELAVSSNPIEVVLEKSPVNVPMSVQTRILMLHGGHGIGIHPTQSKSYNADFDGDNGILSFDHTQNSRYNRAMSLLIGTDGKPTIDPDYFPVLPFEEESESDTAGKIEDTQTLFEEFMKREFEWFNFSFDKKQTGGKLFAAYVDMNNSPTEENWTRFLELIQIEARIIQTNAINQINAGNEISPRYTQLDTVMSSLLRTFYDFSRERSVRSLIGSFALWNDEYIMMLEEAETTPLHPVVYSLIRYSDEIILSGSPGTVQEFTVYYNKQFINPADGKNIPFRLISDFAKAIKRTDLLINGDELHGLSPVAKLDKDGNIVPTKDSLTILDLYSFTSAAAFSRKVGQIAHTGSRELAVMTQVKGSVLGQLRNMASIKVKVNGKEFDAPMIGGVPVYRKDGVLLYNSIDVNDAVFRAWIDEFIRIYNREAKMLGISQVDYRNDLTPVGDKKFFEGVDTDTYVGLEDALLRVFGDFRIGQIFPNIHSLSPAQAGAGYSAIDRWNEGNKEGKGDLLLAGYISMTLSQFVEKQRIWVGSENGEAKFKRINWRMNRERKNGKFVKGRNAYGVSYTPFDILILLGDRRSKQYGEYSEAWTNATDVFYKTFRSWNKDPNKAGGVFQLKIKGEEVEAIVPENTIIEAMTLLGPDMFTYFGMDTTAFWETQHGQEILKAVQMDSEVEGLDQFRNALLMMLLDYRLARVTELRSEKDNFDEMHPNLSPVESQKLLAEIDAKIDAELEALASSSPAWEAIISETGKTAFEELKYNSSKMSEKDKDHASKIVGAFNAQGHELSDYETSAETAENERVKENLQNLPLWVDMFKKGEGATTGSRISDRYESGFYFVKDNVFWADAEAVSRSNDILDVLTDKGISFEAKMKTLRDVTRAANRFYSINEKEMIAMLAHNPNRLHSGARFEMSDAFREQIDTVKESTDRLETAARRQQKIDEQSFAVIAKAKADPGWIDRQVKALASIPGWHVHVDTILAADAVASIYMKTFQGDSDKGRNQPSCNGYFNALSIQRSGGCFTHLNQTDNAVVASIGYDQVSIKDIISIMADPELEIAIYDMYGNPARDENGNAVRLNQEILYGFDENGDRKSALRFLEENPLIACSLSQFGVDVDGTIDGRAYLCAYKDSDLGQRELSDEDIVFALLNDRYRFLALSALMTPVEGNVERNMPELINQNLKELCSFVIHLSHIDTIKHPEAFDEAVISFFGITRENLVKIFKSRQLIPGTVDQYYLDYTEEDEDQFLSDAEEIQEEVIKELKNCVKILTKAGIYFKESQVSYDIVTPSATITKTVAPDGVFRRKKNTGFGSKKPDIFSIAAYFDAKQQLAGSRVKTMIGIEGAETKKNLMLKHYLRSHQDEYYSAWDEEAGKVVVRKFSESGNGKKFHDKSLEVNSKKQKRSIAKFLEIKREQAAEAFNMKAKKYGDDGTNSIIKFIAGTTNVMSALFGKKVTTTDSQRKQTSEYCWTLEDGAGVAKTIEEANSREEAVEILAMQLMDADMRLGYIDIKFDDQTEADYFDHKDRAFDPADYFNRASLMIAEDFDINEDGTPTIDEETGQPRRSRFVIRTLEQLSTAMNTRISEEAIEQAAVWEEGKHSKDEVLLIDQELRQVAEELGTNHDTWAIEHPQEARSSISSWLNGIQVAAFAASSKRPSRALRPYSSGSNFPERNYVTIKDIIRQYEETENTEFVFRNEDELRGYWRNVTKIKDETKAPIPPSDVNKFNEVLSKKFTIVGIATTREDLVEKVTPGGKHAVVFPTIDGYNGAEYIACLDLCRQYGMTAAFTDEGISRLPNSYKRYEKDAIQISEHCWIIPFFDIKVNGGATDHIGPAPTEFPMLPSMISVEVKSTSWDRVWGDAEAAATSECLDRQTITFESSEPTMYSMDDLFPNAIEAADIRGTVYYMQTCNKEDIKMLLDRNGKLNFDPKTGTIHGISQDITIDIGMKPGQRGYAREMKRVERKLKEYFANFDSCDDEGFRTDECKPDTILGIVQLVGQDHTVSIAPVWGFHAQSKGKAPKTFKIVERGIDQLTGQFYFTWKYTGSLLGHTVKYFSGVGASNKFMIFGKPIRSRKLANGWPVDIMFNAASTSGRMFSSNERINTMCTAMMLTHNDPNYTYNFAELDESFPVAAEGAASGNPWNQGMESQVRELKQRLLIGDLSIDDWKNLTGYKNGHISIRLHADDQINAVATLWLDRCLKYGTVNPTTLFATHVINEEGGYQMLHPKYAEYEVFMDTSYAYQEAWMKMMNAMCPTLLPPSIEYQGGGKYLFKPVNKNLIYKTENGKTKKRHPNKYSEADYGVLQMLVPYWDEKGNMYVVPETVYMAFGFFGDDSSAFRKINSNAYSRSLDTMNVGAYVTPTELAEIARFARANVGGYRIVDKEIDSSSFMIDGVDLESEA